MKKESVIIERTYNASVENVWAAITDVEQMRQWYFPPLEEFEPEIGFETRFDVPNDGKVFSHIWKVTEVIPNKKISYDWKFGGYPGTSVVSFEVFADGDRTRIVLTHRGLETFNGNANPDLAVENFVQGWTHFVGTALKEYVEKETEE